MQRDVVCGIQVYSLDDVDFSSCGPVVEICRPEGGPGPTGRRGEVRKVGDDENFVVCVL